MVTNVGSLIAPWLSAARTYIDRGWHVIPLHNPTDDPQIRCSCRQKDCPSPAKHPRTPHGDKDASAAPEMIEAWAEAFPFSNLGIALAPSGLVAVSPDSAHWAAEFEQFGLPAAPRFQSGGGLGHWHHLMRRPDGCPMHRICRTGEYDILSNGYIVCPPSRHVSERAYNWIQPPEVFPELPAPPDWVVARLQEAANADIQKERERAEQTSLRANWMHRGASDQDYSQLDYWSGRRRKTKPLGETDRSATLNAIAWELAGVGATEAQIERELAERDELLGFQKFRPRKDGGAREYTRMARKAVDHVIPRARPYHGRQHPANTNGNGRVAQQTGSGNGVPPEVSGTAPAPQGAPEELHHTDLGNARRLVLSHGADLRFTQAHGWLQWDERRWQRDQTGEAKRRAKATVRAMYLQAAAMRAGECQALATWALRSEEARRIRDMLGLAESELEVSVHPDAFDKKPLLLNLLNGTLDLETLTLREHRRDDLLTKLCPVHYDPDALCPQFAAFLDRIFKGDAELIHYVQKAVGYSLTGDVSEQTLFFLHGMGANGKSTLLRVLLALLGELGTQAAPGLLLARNGDRHPTEIADLASRRLVVSMEVGEGKRLAEELVKQMTGADRMKGRFMRRDFFEFEPEFRLWLAANHKPIIRGTDWAIWRRIPLIPFNVRFEDRREDDPDQDPARIKDPQLTQKLLDELPGILTWAARGYQLWAGEGLKPPEAVREATAAYRAEMDLVGAFIEERCVLNPAASVQTTGLYQEYVDWCEQSGETAISQRLFADRLKERDLQPERTGKERTRIWRGIGLLHASDAARSH